MSTDIVESLSTFAYDEITVAAAAIGLTSNNVLASPPARKVIITIEDAQIRWRDDGTDPTASVGRIANPTDTIVLNHGNRISNFRAIRTGSTSATLNVDYLR